MMRFAEVFPDTDIVHALRAQLSWNHLREFIAIDDSLKPAADERHRCSIPETEHTFESPTFRG